MPCSKPPPAPAAGCALAAALWFAIGTPGRAADEPALPQAKPVPLVQVLPLPYDQASFQRAGRELARYHFGRSLKRPFLYPILGPAGRSLTRMGHPHDPATHSHHNSVWIAHQNVGGVSFWEDSGDSRIQCDRVLEYEDGDTRAHLLAENSWRQGNPGRVLMLERRRIEIRTLGKDQWLVLIDLQLRPPGKEPLTLGQTPFGMIGVRMAKTIGVSDGGGRILNSQGQRNEQQVFRQPARWVDYSGPVTNRQTGGIALLDHPQNPGHPTPFHVRNDGWMGACLTLNGPLVIPPQQPLRLRWGLWVHAGVPDRKAIDAQWQAFAQEPLPSIERSRR